MVLRGKLRGRVGRRRLILHKMPLGFIPKGHFAYAPFSDYLPEPHRGASFLSAAMACPRQQIGPPIATDKNGILHRLSRLWTTKEGRAMRTRCERGIQGLAIGVMALGILGMTGCGQPAKRAAEAGIVTFTGKTMGTTYTVKVVAERLAAPQRADIEQAIAGVLDMIDRQMSTWRPDSELSRFNAMKSTKPVKVSLELREVLACAQEVSRISGGAFDVTVSPLLDAWGFGPKSKGDRVPSETELEAIKKRVGYQKLQIFPKPGTIRKAVADLEVDLGALAPGYGSDKIAKALESLGYTSYMVELGGEVRAAGQRPDGKPWRIAIERPDAAGRAIYKAVPLSGQSLSTSGDYRDYFEKDGVRYSHTINPKTGRPITHNLASVTVIHEECMWADAYATALDVLGPEQGYQLALRENLPVMFLVREKTGVFTELVTPRYVEMYGRSAQEEAAPAAP